MPPPPPDRLLRRARFWPPVVLLLCILTILAQRVHTYAEPLENDIAGYAIIGHELMHGRRLYSDLWERKPPLLYTSFAAAELLVGYGRAEIFLVNVVAAIATLFAVYLAGAAGPHGRRGGWIAAVMWALLCGDLHMQANQPNAEVLLNVWLTAAFALLLRWPTRRSLWPALLLGLFFAAATLIKHHVAITCAALAAGYVVFGARFDRDTGVWPVPEAAANPDSLQPKALSTGRRRQRPVSQSTASVETAQRTFHRRVREMLVSVSVVAASWGIALAYFAVTGRWAATIDVLFHQNAAYAGSLWHNLVVSLAPANLFQPFLSWIVGPMALLLVFALFAMRSDRWFNQWQWKLWIVWAIGTWPAVALPGHLFPHYYQLWMPVWCIAGGWAAAGLLDRNLRIPSLFRYGTIAAALIFLACRELPSYSLTPDQWADRKYPGGNYVQQERLGQLLGCSVLRPNEQFWVLGDDNSLYFAARKPPPSGLLYIDPLINGDEQTAYNQRLVDDLERAKPALVLVSPLAERLPADAPVFAWIRREYKPWPTKIAWIGDSYARQGAGLPHYLMFVRKGSELERREKTIDTGP